jgi:hypothetical protein
MATTLAVWCSAGSPPTHDDAVRRIHDTLGVDRIHFESGYPKAGLKSRWRSRNGRPRAAVERAGGLRCCGA